MIASMAANGSMPSSAPDLTLDGSTIQLIRKSAAVANKIGATAELRTAVRLRRGYWRRVRPGRPLRAAPGSGAPGLAALSVAALWSLEDMRFVMQGLTITRPCFHNVHLYYTGAAQAYYTCVGACQVGSHTP
jgi:hypothetical protein